MNIEDMKDKAYRHGIVSAQIDIDLPLQLRALRKQRGWKQPELAERANMKQPRISAMEKPGAVSFTLETLRRMAEAFDVALIVRFAPFSELWRWSNNFDPDSFNVPEFSQDGGFALPEQLAAASLQMNVNLAGDVKRANVPDSMNVLARQVTQIVTADSLSSMAHQHNFRTLPNKPWKDTAEPLPVMLFLPWGPRVACSEFIERFHQVCTYVGKNS